MAHHQHRLLLPRSLSTGLRLCERRDSSAEFEMSMVPVRASGVIQPRQDYGPHSGPSYG